MIAETNKPAEVAKRWRCKVQKVLTFIRTGELAAFDISTKPGSGKPRWLITDDSVKAFEEARAAKRPTKRKRRSRNAAVEKYFPELSEDGAGRGQETDDETDDEAAKTERDSD